MRNINHQLMHFVRIPKQTTILLLEVSYFATNADSREVYMNNRMTLLHMCKKSSDVIAIATFGEHHMLAVALHSFEARNHVVVSTVLYFISYWPLNHPSQSHF